VFSIDKAELAPRVAAMPGVNHCAGSSAFGLEPQNAGKADWLFCDVACYPSRLWTMIKRWLEKRLLRIKRLF
jgi:23S rRNA (cytidine2498-2'-O)-methyltransferase